MGRPDQLTDQPPRYCTPFAGIGPESLTTPLVAPDVAADAEMLDDGYQHAADFFANQAKPADPIIDMATPKRVNFFRAMMHDTPAPEEMLPEAEPAIEPAAAPVFTTQQRLEAIWAEKDARARQAERIEQLAEAERPANGVRRPDPHHVRESTVLSHAWKESITGDIDEAFVPFLKAVVGAVLREQGAANRNGRQPARRPQAPWAQPALPADQTGNRPAPGALTRPQAATNHSGPIITRPAVTPAPTRRPATGRQPAALPPQPPQTGPDGTRMFAPVALSGDNDPQRRTTPVRRASPGESLQTE